MVDPVALSEEELGWFRGQKSGNFRREETGARLLATIESRDQRIRRLVEVAKATEKRGTTVTYRASIVPALDALQPGDLDV